MEVRVSIWDDVDRSMTVVEVGLAMVMTVVVDGWTDVDVREMRVDWDEGVRVWVVDDEVADRDVERV